MTWRALRELGDFTGWMRDCLAARNSHVFVPQTCALRHIFFCFLSILFVSSLFLLIYSFLSSATHRCAFVALLQRLLHSELYGARPNLVAQQKPRPELGRPALTEMQTYVDFAVNDVFMKWDLRSHGSGRMWQVCAESLGVVSMILDDYASAGEHVEFKVARELRVAARKKRKAAPDAASLRRSRSGGRGTPTGGPGAAAADDAQPWSVGFDLLLKLLSSPRRRGAALLLKIIGVVTYTGEGGGGGGARRGEGARSAADVLAAAKEQAAKKGAPLKPRPCSEAVDSPAHARQLYHDRIRDLDAEKNTSSVIGSSALVGGTRLEWEWIAWRERAVERALRILAALVHVQDQFIVGVQSAISGPMQGDLALSQQALDRLAQLEPVSPLLYGGARGAGAAHARSHGRRRGGGPVAVAGRTCHPLEHVAAWTQHEQRGNDGIARYALALLSGLSQIAASSTGAASGNLALARVFSDSSNAAIVLTEALARRMNAAKVSFEPTYWEIPHG